MHTRSSPPLDQGRQIFICSGRDIPCLKQGSTFYVKESAGSFRAGEEIEFHGDLRVAKSVRLDAGLWKIAT
jgi:hypothetical protein